MDCVNSTTDIITSKKPKVVRNIIGTSEDGKWNICFNETTGKKSYIPSDPEYFNKFYHANRFRLILDFEYLGVYKIITKKSRL